MIRILSMSMLLWFTLASVPNSWAQQLRISGTVDDGAGVIAGATVLLRDPAGVTNQISTDAMGKYQFDGLRDGTYEVIISRDGYAPTSRTVTLPSDSSTVDITLRVAEVLTSIDVVDIGGLANSLTVPTTAGSRLNLPSLDMPVSVTTLSGADIRLRGDATVNAAVTRAVGITPATGVRSAGNTVAARGFGGSSVAFLYDGIRNMAALGNLGWPFDPWTVDRIEVLNGPASVLYGIGGIGGSINIVPRRPSANSQHTARISGGSFDTYKFALDTTGPISERVLYRFDISRQQSNGYIDRGDNSSWAVSGSLAFMLSDKLRLTLMNDWSYIKPMPYYGLPMVNGVALRSLIKENYITGDNRVYFNDNSSRVEFEWTPKANVSVRNVTSLLHGDRLWRHGATEFNYRSATDDIIRSGYFTFDHDQIQWNNQTEVTWKTRLGGRDNTIAFGTDFERLNYRWGGLSWPGATSIVSLHDPIPGISLPNSTATVRDQRNLVNRYSVFAEDRIELTSALSVVGGLRFDSQHLRRIDLATPERTENERTYNPVNWRVGAVYKVLRDTNLYAQYSKAIDSISGIVSITAAQMALNPSRGHQVEAGVKQSIRGGRLEWTVAGYRIVKKDLLVPDPLVLATLIQVGQQSSKGVEATIGFDLTSTLRIGANGTVLRPQFDEFFENVGGIRTSRNGNQPTNVPWQSGNILATWSFKQNWLAQGTLRFVGKRYIDNGNTLDLPAYKVVDASLRRSISERAAIDFRLNNIFDTFYAYNFSGNGRGGGNWNVGVPRSFEISLTTGF